MDPGFSRGGGLGGQLPGNLLFHKMFAKNCMKMKKILTESGGQGSHAPWIPHGITTVVFFTAIGQNVIWLNQS